MNPTRCAGIQDSVDSLGTEAGSNGLEFVKETGSIRCLGIPPIRPASNPYCPLGQTHLQRPLLLPPQIRLRTVAVENGHAPLCFMQSQALASARGYRPRKTAFASNDMGVVLKTKEVNDHSNFAEFHFT